MKKILKILKYILKKRFHALDFDSIFYNDVKQAYVSGEIQLKYQISFEDLLLKYRIPPSTRYTKIFLKWELGSISDLETCFLCSIASGTQAKKIFEIGTYLGRTALNLAYNTENDVQIYTLNLPQETCPYIVGKHLKEHQEFSKKIIQLLGDSRKFDFSLYRGQIDLMFIDGDHHYDSVINDSKKAINCVKKGGFIIWHDFDYLHLGSCKAIIETCNAYRLDLNKISVTPLAITQLK